MPAPLLAIAAIGAVAELGRQIHNSYSTAYEEAKARGELGVAANSAWAGDRSTILSERGRLETGFDGSFAKPVLTGKLDGFSALSHQQIWDALNGSGSQPGVDAGEINAGADGWRRLVTGMTNAVTQFNTRIDTAIRDGWDGTTANAAIDGVRTYSSEAQKLPTTFQMVGNGIDLMQGALAQAKMAIPEPYEVPWDEVLLAKIPGSDFLKSDQYQADEAERAAQEILERVYKPQAVVADEKTPVLAVPKNPLGDGNVPGGDNNNGDGSRGGSTNGNSNGSTPGGDQSSPAATTPQSTNPTTDTPEDDSSTDDSSGDETSPTATTPTATPSTEPASTPQSPTAAPGAGTPGSGAPGGGGSPGGGSPGAGGAAQAPVAGRGVPGSPSAGMPAAASAGKGAGAGGRGMSGMPGMMGGGGRGGGKDDESEHKIPDYLIQDRESELIGQLPPTLPPGGVIGA
ncbi:PPE domain-containing protein [Nocardia sp. IBHARD005]|uniref:PPE domain-containing protein n=1 Tax=Nocardia sp. IBHARD005 TaxID=3457765 RepID=UPI004058286E